MNCPKCREGGHYVELIENRLSRLCPFCGGRFMKIVEIVWLDVDVRRRNVGYLIKDADDTYVISSGLLDNEVEPADSDETLTIRKGWVIEIEELA